MKDIVEIIIKRFGLRILLHCESQRVFMSVIAVDRYYRVKLRL